MLRLKLPHNLRLLLLLAARPAHLLLPLIVHHLADHAARLAVQVAEFTVLGHDFRRVDPGRRGDDVRPPFQLVGLVQVQRDLFLCRCRRRFERPGRFVEEDRVRELALWIEVSLD